MKTLKNWLLQRLLTPEELRVVNSILQASRYQPEPTITKDDAKAWGAALRSPVGMKIDAAMINWLHVQAQTAIIAPPRDTLAQAKYALGCRVGWEMAKNLSRLATAHSGESEDDQDNTATGALDQNQP